MNAQSLIDPADAAYDEDLRAKGYNLVRMRKKPSSFRVRMNFAFWINLFLSHTQYLILFSKSDDN